MEPEGDLLTPGTSYGPPASDTENISAANTFVSHTLQASYSPTLRDELLPVCGEPWSLDADGSAFDKIDGSLSREESGRNAQRTFRPSAFPSSLAWDSDSERETIDEEDLQHFSNPHGLAAHSPGSPSSGLRCCGGLESQQIRRNRLDSREVQTPEEIQPLISEKEKTKPLEREPTGSSLREEPKISSAQDLSMTEMADEPIWNASLIESTVKPKEGHQIEKEEEEAEIKIGGETQKGKNIKGREKDVYTFPGDSDPESPSPPAPWVHPTFTQRRRKKRALLRPFSDVGTWQSSSPGALRRARGGPQRSKGAKSTQLRGSRPVCDFEEDLGKECAEEGVFVQEEKEENKKGGEEEEEGGEGGVADEDMSKEIYTCVECSIYFKKQDHLQEHMAEHYQSGGSGAAGRRGRLAKGCRFRCLECGWNLSSSLALTDHRQRHQESRRKILEEIGKLSDGGKGDGETRNREGSVPEAALSALVVVPERNQAPVPDSALVSASDPVPEPEPEQAPLPVPGRQRGCASGGNRRQFVCNKCDFATRTSQAMANHAKTHNRPPKVGVQRSSPRLRQRRLPVEPDYPSILTCDLCAFQASSPSMLREHRSLAHPEQASVSGVGHEGVIGYPGTSSGSLYSIRSIPDPDEFSGHESTAAPRAVPESQRQPGSVVVDGSLKDLQFPVPHTRELAFKCIGNGRVNKRGQGWTGDSSLCPRLDSNRGEIENEYADRLRGNSNLATELNEEKTNSTAGFKPHTTTRSRLDCTSTHQSPTLLGNPAEKRVKEEEQEEEEEEAAIFSPVKKNASAVANKNSHSNENDYDEEEQIRHLVAKGILEEDEDEIDEETGTCVERKCPYCPDRFHNGIGLANHVRGHLNRVGVSYNVRHFISPEEVNAIEKKFSYQKKKKKVANFDPDTFSVMRCEFCSAGFDTRAGLSSHARAHLRDFGITNWEVTVSPIHILRELFSSRPDLVIPLAPPRSPGSQPEDQDEEEEEEGDVHDLYEEGGNLGTAGEPSGERKERETRARFSNLMSSTSPQPWKTEHSVEELGDGEEDGEEDDDEAEQQRQPADLDSLSSSPGKKGLLSLDTENPCLRVEANAKGPNLLRCEVCGARFETRRGLSSHARSHLRQLGIGVSESSGAPIDLLYQISKERSLDSHLPSAPPQSPSAKKPPRVPPVSHDDGPFEEDMDYEEKPVLSVSSLTKAVKVRSSASSPSPAASPPPSTLTGSSSSSPSPVVKKAPISSLLPVSSPLRSLDHKPVGIKSLSSSLSAAAAAAAAAAVSPSSAPSTTTTSSMSKPFWAPQETDAPLNLTLEVDPNKDIICQLCGAWFETRKGLSSHARAHLRHFGVEYSESKGSPIDLLNQLIHTDDFKHRASALQPAGASDVRSLTPGLSSHKRSVFNATSSSSSSSPLLYKVTTVGGSGAVATSSSVSLLGPAPKRSKSSTMQVFRLSTGELMSMPHNEPTKEIGCEFCGEYFENRKGLSSHARSHLRQMGITEWSVNGSPIDTLREIITQRGLPCALPLRTLKTPPPSSPGPPRSPLSTSSSSPSSASLLGRLPFAFARPSSPQTPVRKMGSGSRSSSTGLVLKLKPEPVQLEVTMPGTVGGSGTYNAESLNCSWSSSDNMFPLNLAMAQEVEPTRDIRCEFCGEYFENRKGLSSHARSHLRQMGITEWSVNGSPIDTLREIMHKRGTTLSSSTSSSSSPAQGVKKESSPTWDGLGGLGGLSSLASLGFQSPKFSRKSPLNLLHSGSRLHKHGLGAVGLSATPPPGKFFGVSALGKRPLSEDSCSLESTRSPPPPQPKTFSPLPHDFSFKGKSSPDKHGGGHQDASCELCGFYFENRKALASHARAHLRQFGVTEWCVNGSPIETLSAWMRSRPHKVVEMHRSYMQGSHSTPKKKSSSPRSPPSDSDHAPSHRTTSAQWSALGLNQARPVGREVTLGSPKAADGESGSGPVALYSSRSSHGGPAPSHGRHGNHSAPPPHAQVARSELNVRLPRGTPYNWAVVPKPVPSTMPRMGFYPSASTPGFERRPLKHPSHPEGVERESGPAKPPRTGTIPALVPKPPSTPLVKLVGKFYTLKCRFCEVEFHGPLSVQEDWIRHLQQHILQLNYGKPSSATAVDSAAQPEKQPEPDAATLSATAPTGPSTTQRTPSPPPVKNDPVPEPSSSPPPPPTPPTGSDATVTATPTAPASTQPLVSPSPIPITVPSQAL